MLVTFYPAVVGFFFFFNYTFDFVVVRIII